MNICRLSLLKCVRNLVGFVMFVFVMISSGWMFVLSVVIR